MNKRFLLNPEKNLGTDPCCRSQEKRKKKRLTAMLSIPKK